ncbi:Membrane fusion protein mtrC precursor [Brucella intermedia LMG 3301]|uniref:Membrane fusion protein mtrC n=1 Tax=Brucella intermedia LMG 3301 TaxID=641118 RepID=C4WG94_9HYPH|nr:Membrane fusion protein mtrC precursor [Brucella intermedia LMG 3301]
MAVNSFVYGLRNGGGRVVNRHVFPRFGMAIIVLACMGLLVPGATFQARADELNVVPVAAVKAVASDYQPKLTLSGSIAARSLVNVSFRLNGQVVQRLVEVGQHVEKGQPLASIDDVEQQANLRVAQASKDAAQAQLVQAEANFARQKALLGARVYDAQHL